MVSDGAMLYSEGTLINKNQMLIPTVYTGFDYDNVWYIDKNEEYKYPKLYTEIREIFFKDKSVNVDKDKNIALELLTKPLKGFELSKVTWESADTDIATVDDKGIVTGVNKGNTVVTATTENGLKCNIQVNVLIPIDSITLNENSIELDVGNESKLFATISPLDATDEYSFSSSDENIATVDASGNIKAISKGIATIHATSSRGVDATCTVDVKLPATDIKLSETEKSVFLLDDISLEAIPSPLDTTDEIIWNSSNTNVATVANGKVSILKNGEVVISAETQRGISSSCLVKINNDIANTSIELEKNSFGYDGNEINPKVFVKYNDISLEEGKDFTVEYNNNKNAGKASVIVKGIDRFSGEKILDFDITKKVLVESNVEVDTANEVYSGEEFNKVILVKDNETVLKENEDYTVEYVSNVNAGNAKIIITGINNYDGTVEKTFTIDKAPQNEIGEVDNNVVHVGLTGNVNYKGKGEPTYRTSDEKVVSIDEDGVFTAKKPGEAVITVISAGDENYEITETKIEITVTDHDYKEIITPATQEKDGVITKKCNLCDKEITKNISKVASITLDFISKDYTGKVMKPAVTIKSADGKKISTDNYSVTYKTNCKNGGKHIVEVLFKGNYKGKATKSFKINPISQVIDASDISVVCQNNKKKIGAKLKVGDGSLKYTSKNTKVAVVDSKGNIKAKAVGVAKIIIEATKTDNYKKSTKQVTVTVTPRKVSISKISSDKNGQISLKWSKENGVKGYEVRCATDSSFGHAKKLSINKGSICQKSIVNLKKEQVYYVQVRAVATINKKKIYGDWSKAKKVKTLGVKISASRISVPVGGKEKLKVTGGRGKVTWTSTNPSVVTVSNGTIVGNSAGSAVVYAVCNGMKVSCNVTVKELSLNRDSMQMAIGDKKNLSFNVSVSNARFSSSNNGVARVTSDGDVIAVGEGNATITVSAYNRSYECSVSVAMPNLEIEPISIVCTESYYTRYYSTKYIVRNRTGNTVTIKTAAMIYYPDFYGSGGADISKAMIGNDAGDQMITKDNPVIISSGKSKYIYGFQGKQYYSISGSGATILSVTINGNDFSVVVNDSGKIISMDK